MPCAKAMGLWLVVAALLWGSAAVAQDNMHRSAEREPPEVAVKWISPDINAGKWEGYTPPPLPQ